MYLRDFFALKPFHDYSLCSVCILPQPAFYSQSAVCILPQSAVCVLHWPVAVLKFFAYHLFNFAANMVSSWPLHNVLRETMYEDAANHCPSESHNGAEVCNICCPTWQQRQGCGFLTVPLLLHYMYWMVICNLGHARKFSCVCQFVHNSGICGNPHRWWNIF